MQTRTPRPIPELSEADRARFLAKVIKLKPNDCWMWTGYLMPGKGYGAFSMKRPYLAHRVAWLVFTGKQPPLGLELDHTCFNRWCVNPAHLRPLEKHEHGLRNWYEQHAPEHMPRMLKESQEPRPEK